MPYIRKVLLCCLIVSGLALAGANNTKVILLKKTTAQITIDGIAEPAWDTADSLSDFIQQSPFHGKEPTRRTVAKVLTTEKALYCLITCYSDKTSIQQIAGKLDDGSGDIVSIMLDTFGDNRTAYKFAVTAAGVRADCRLLDDGRNRDYSWDGVWFAGAKVYDWGFVVEMEIPYRSIQYDENLHEWGLDFDRFIPNGSEDIYWCPYEENEGQRISKFGKLVFTDFQPSVKGLNLEIYPVAISKATYLMDGKYKGEPDAGIDIFYNPSQSLTYQLTANPDFAQIEADPFNFNISRYETYFNERRPFFTQGNEVFMASGKERNSGFYSPLELFYSRRIGKKLPDGSEVPLNMGTKAFGRLGDWEYGGFLAATGGKDYTNGMTSETEDRATFYSGRIKRQIFGNSSIGILYVGKHTATDDNGVIDLDGAFRASDWQLSYQLAHSYRSGSGDYAASAGLMAMGESWFTAVRGRFIGANFDVSEVGFVPWTGTGDFVGLTGPQWFFKEGGLRALQVYGGGVLGYKRVEAYTDHQALLGINLQFRSNWGFEIDYSVGRSKDQAVEYSSYEVDISSWFNISPSWYGNFFSTIARTYNFPRNYVAPFFAPGLMVGWYAMKTLELGTSFFAYVEGNPNNAIEEITYNSRPYFSLTPVNDLNLRVYFDNVYVRSSRHLEQFIVGFLFSYNFLPKSWIYLALNEVGDRSDQFDTNGGLLPNRMHVTSRAGVLKVKYLYYL